MKRILLTGVVLCVSVWCRADFRPPAVPLVQCDPFFSVWSAADRLTDVETTHWTGVRQPISILLEADGKTWRLCGLEPTGVPALPQASLDVRPTQTVCTFKDGSLSAELRFSTAKLPDDLDVFSRPVTYVTARVSGAKEWKLVPSISPALATNDDKAPVVTNTATVAGMQAVSIGRAEQKPLGMIGDRVRCNWGYAWLVGPSAVKGGESHFILAYDDVKSIRFFGKDLPAWWHRNGLSFTAMLEQAEKDYATLLAKLDAFDAEFTADMRKLGGEKYARIAALSYRQSFAACKLVADANGQPFYFSKENGSGGLIGTTDVFYPQMPHLLLTSPSLAKATLAPTCIYAASEKWPYPYAPHDLGVYPVAEGQFYGMKKGQAVGGGTDDTFRMPVEECGNMLISLAAVATAEGNADFAGRWWGEVTKWAEYLTKFGYDPGNQLCTDDFAGHLAHNGNLSVKSIVALACYARLAEMRGERETAAKYASLAKGMVPQWIAAAKGGRHGAAKLVLGPCHHPQDTWAQKYNLVWDRILGLNLFPKEIAEREVAAYRQLLLPYGLPLDSRLNYTKADWTVWSATLTGKREDFEALIAPLYRFVNETPDRIPFTDWYWADNGRFRGFIARSVIGGVFIPALYDAAIWKKYRSRDKGTTGEYAMIQ
ncbi:MAG: DUF4965 domain-containing protein [Kiritimatiellae bacterium]|nr:DUF4965 domain-containing protein [Kiritimatiellia bacterium]